MEAVESPSHLRGIEQWMWHLGTRPEWPWQCWGRLGSAPGPEDWRIKRNEGGLTVKEQPQEGQEGWEGTGGAAEGAGVVLLEQRQRENPGGAAPISTCWEG